MKKRYLLPAMVLSAAALSFLGQNLNSAFHHLVSVITPAAERKRSFSPYSQRQGTVQRVPRLSELRPILTEITTDSGHITTDTGYITAGTGPETAPVKEINRTAAPGDANLELILKYVPNLSSNSNFSPNHLDTNDDPDFASNCPGQCLYVENDDGQGYTRYDLDPGTVLTARIDDNESYLRYCTELSSPCETGLFILDRTYLVIDNENDFTEFGKTRDNTAEKSLTEYIQRIPNISPPSSEESEE